MKKFKELGEKFKAAKREANPKKKERLMEEIESERARLQAKK